MRHPLFKDIAKEKPLKISEMSHIAPFDPKDYKAAIAAKGVYTCGANLFWANLFYTACPGVPINRTGVCASNQSLFSAADLCNCSVGSIAIQACQAYHCSLKRCST